MTDQELLDYLLGELGDPEAAALERRLAADPQLRARIERMRPTVATLDALPGEAWQLPAPPPLAARAPRRRVLTFRPLVAAACAVVLLLVGGLVGGLIARDDDSQPAAAQELRLAPLGNAPADAQGTVRVAPDDGDGARLTVTGLKPLADDDFYELWLLGKDGELIGLGSFRVDASGAATVTVPVPVDPGGFRYFDVSLEPSDGDPGHSGDSVLRAPTTS
jgi:anti-sigma-K factor RskA